MVFTREKFTGEVRGKEREHRARRDSSARQHQGKQKGGKR